MKQVTKVEFFEFVNPRDIVVGVVKMDNLDSASEWKTRNGLLVGRTETIYDYELEEQYRKKYFLRDEIINGQMKVPLVEGN